MFSKELELLDKILQLQKQTAELATLINQQACIIKQMIKRIIKLEDELRVVKN